jgi:tetratricopeptide (TPR) repeat protein
MATSARREAGFRLRTSGFRRGTALRRILPVLAALALPGFLSACGAGKGPGDRAGSAFTEGHPLAMRPVTGDAALDRRIGDLQERLRRGSRSPEDWAALAEAWVMKARADADPGLYHGAEDAARAALALRPELPRAFLVRGLVLMEAHRFEDARALAAALVARAPAFSPGHGLLSDALLELGRFEEAADVAQRMMDLKPDLPAYVRASHLRWLAGDVPGALEAARLAVDAGGTAEARTWARTQGAIVRWHAGDLAGADRELALALADSPEHPAALAARGRVALSRGDSAAARELLERAFRRSPLPETAWLLGDARAAAGDAAGADEAYGRVVRDGRAFDPRTLALFLATKGRDPEEALVLARKELRIRRDVHTEDALAWALYRAGRIDEAARAAARATRLGTPDARLLYHEGAIRLARGERAAGLSLLRRALRLNPAFDLTGAAEARRLLAGAGRAAAVAVAGRLP